MVPRTSLALKTAPDAQPTDSGASTAELIYALVCALLIVAGACIFREQFGTHRLPIHIVSLALVAIYTAIWKGRLSFGARWKRLGLTFPPNACKWMAVFVLVGVFSGGLRFVVSRQVGGGGLDLYRGEFTNQLIGSSPADTAVRWIVFAAVLYLAVLVPGMLLCGVIQNVLEQARMFVVGLVVQSLSFGLVHCYMTGSFNPNYGVETFCGAIIYGWAFHSLRSLHPPTIFMVSNVLTVTLLCGLLP